MAHGYALRLSALLRQGKGKAAKTAKATPAEDALLCPYSTGVYKQGPRALGIKAETRATSPADGTRRDLRMAIRVPGCARTRTCRLAAYCQDQGRGPEQ
jgi:hypothetical protein